jgi:hypothetical protein
VGKRKKNITCHLKNFSNFSIRCGSDLNIEIDSLILRNLISIAKILSYILPFSLGIIIEIFSIKCLFLIDAGQEVIAEPKFVLNLRISGAKDGFTPTAWFEEVSHARF